MAKAGVDRATREQVIAELTGNRTLRAEAIKMLARDFPKEYLKLVKVDQARITKVAPDILVSDKEWQE